MIDKNPYEKDEVNVPDFSNQETAGNGPIFDMDTTSVTSQTDTFDPMEEAESSSKTAIIVLVVFLVLFLIGSISGWIFGITKSKEAASIQEDYEALKIKTDKQINDLNNEIDDLNSKLQASTITPGNTDTPSTGGETTTTASEHYMMEEGVSVRTGAGTSNPLVSYNSLPKDIQNIVFHDGDKVTTRNASFPVYETKTDSESLVWGRIADGAWVCLKYGTKQ